MRYQKTMASIFLAFLFSYGCDKNPTQSVEYGKGDDYEIYQKVLIESFGETDYLVILNDSTVSSDIDSNQISSLHEWIPEIKDETITDFIIRNEEKSRLKPIRGIGFYVFQSEYKESDQETAMVYLSPVGYDDARTQAIFEMGVIYAPLVGDGTLFFLTKEDGEWKVLGRFLIWIS